MTLAAIDCVTRTAAATVRDRKAHQCSWPWDSLLRRSWPWDGLPNFRRSVSRRSDLQKVILWDLGSRGLPTTTSQETVGDVSYMKAMIPHHSIAIQARMCKPSGRAQPA